MNLKNYFWYFKKDLNKDFCDKVVAFSKTKKQKIGLVGNDITKKPTKDKKYLEKLKKLRDANIVWLNEPWIYATLNHYIHLANKNAGWNFDWDYSESCQFTIYKPGQFYDWHVDSGLDPYQGRGKNLDGKIRKLSCVVLLNEPSDYEGGELTFDIPNENSKKSKEICIKDFKAKGSVIVFPSFVKHKVTPVTKGIRYSLVNWSVGYPFK